MKRWSWIWILILLFAACSVLPERAPVSLYTLALDFNNASQTNATDPVSWRLAVARPVATGPLASPRILVRPTPSEIEVYPQAEWSEPTPGLVGNALIQVLEADPRIPVSVRSAIGLEPDFELLTELRSFHIELANGPVAVVAMKATLVAYPGGHVVSSKLFQTRAPAAGQQVLAAVGALSEALDQLLPTLADWVVMQGQTHWHEASTSVAPSDTAH